MMQQGSFAGSSRGGQFTMTQTDNPYYYRPLFYNFRYNIYSSAWPMAKRMVESLTNTNTNNGNGDWIRRMNGLSEDEKALILMGKYDFNRIMSDPEWEDLADNALALKTQDFFAPVSAAMGYEAMFNQWYFQHYENGEIKMDNHFPDASYVGRGKNVKMRPSVDLVADFGGVFALNKVVDFYVGAYCKYGFLNILPKEKTSLIGSNEQGEMMFQGTLGSDMLDLAYQNNEIKKNKTKWNLLQIGLKAGFHFKACATPAEKSKKQLEKEILEELKKKSNEPIIIKQDPQYIYIVPVCDQMDNNDDYLTPDDKAAINELSDVLSKTKILFDLDKDIPKIKDYNDNINRTVEILKANPQLKLIVEGYTCDLGSEQHNRDLAQRRANNVRKLFIQKGVNPDQIETASYTVNDPQNRQNITDPSREEHRAAIFRIVKR